MNEVSSLLDDLGELQDEFHKILLILPDATMRRAEAQQRGPRWDGKFAEWDEYCKSLESDLSGLFNRLDAHLQIINWKGASLPSPYYLELWTLWWKTVRAETRTYQVSEQSSIFTSAGSSAY